MGFKKISIDKYLELHLKINLSENKTDLEKRLKSALKDYKNGVKCSCGNDIWVIGSAAVGNSCFTCITGESQPNEDYEIESALIKNRMPKTANDRISVSQAYLRPYSLLVIRITPERNCLNCHS